MKQSRKKWFVAAICIIVVLALGTGGVIYYKKQEQQKKLPPTEYVQQLEKRTLDEEIQQLCDWKADWKDRSSEATGTNNADYTWRCMESIIKEKWLAKGHGTV